MMVTDLSQFEQIKVVTIDRMYQLLKEAGQVDEPVTSFDIVREVAQKSGAQQVILGTFARAGETIRISGVPGQPRIGPQPYVPIWYSLASTYLEAGDDDQAAHWFGRIAEATVERVEWPIYYVRSFYFLGKIHESRGDLGGARRQYQRFVDYWGEGDMDRERVVEAKGKLGT